MINCPYDPAWTVNCLTDEEAMSVVDELDAQQPVCPETCPPGHPLAIEDRDALTVLEYCVLVTHNEGLLSHREYKATREFVDSLRLIKL